LVRGEEITGEGNLHILPSLLFSFFNLPLSFTEFVLASEDPKGCSCFSYIASSWVKNDIMTYVYYKHDCSKHAPMGSLYETCTFFCVFGYLYDLPFYKENPTIK